MTPSNSLNARLNFVSPCSDDIRKALDKGQSLGIANLESVDLSQMDLKNAEIWAFCLRLV
jgi:uncharacterized protein YjbI with pentapeptide repeats